MKRMTTWENSPPIPTGKQSSWVLVDMQATPQIKSRIIPIKSLIWQTGSKSSFKVENLNVLWSPANLLAASDDEIPLDWNLAPVDLVHLPSTIDWCLKTTQICFFCYDANSRSINLLFDKEGRSKSDGKNTQQKKKHVNNSSRANISSDSILKNLKALNLLLKGWSSHLFIGKILNGHLQPTKTSPPLWLRLHRFSTWSIQKKHQGTNSCGMKCFVPMGLFTNWFPLLRAFFLPFVSKRGGMVVWERVGWPVIICLFAGVSQNYKRREI